MCRKDGTDLFAFTYNESAIWYEYIMDVISFAPDLTYVMVSNGLLNEAPLKELCSVIDAFNIDIKGFNEDFYTNICGAHLDDVLRSLKIVHESGAHLELTYLVIPEYNDNMSEIAEMSAWVRDNLSRDVPLHFTRFHPDNEMMDVPWTPTDTLVRAREIAMEAGLNYVYIGNVMTEEGSDTICPDCGSVIIERTGYLVETVGLDGNCCSNCGRKLSITR
jgi:pyruvate formate lyase activating enzyme